MFLKKDKYISKDEISALLPPERTGNIIVLNSVNSTNSYLKESALSGNAKYGDCVIANSQTAGKGRLGRNFVSVADKGIYLSYSANPKGQSLQTLSQITAWTAVAVSEAIFEITGISAQIKWVNDIVYQHKKLCGILTEMSYAGGNAASEHIIIGIGINVNHGTADFPSELSEIATSLKMICCNQVDRAKLCAKVICKLDAMTNGFPLNKSYYLSEYKKKCVGMGEKIRIIQNNSERTGIAVGIDENFGLKVKFDNGKTETVTGGDVSVRGFYGYI